MTTPQADVAGPLSPGLQSASRTVSGFMDGDGLENSRMSHSVASRRVSSKRFNMMESTAISRVVSSHKRRNVDELGTSTSSKIVNTTYVSLMDWISSQRMSLLPPEGSDYDKVLAWAQLFIESLNSFDTAIEEFAGDSYLAAQLVYGFCAMLLEVCSSYQQRI